jgi:methyl coenzyme M reductase alpha subunit
MQRVATQQVAHAVRTVKFSAEPVDLMAFAEHDNTFHVVDARKFNTRQSVRTSDASIGISGVTFAPKVCAS